jgi:alginate O-acetyltransferase complex protein AlgF
MKLVARYRVASVVGAALSLSALYAALDLPAHAEGKFAQLYAARPPAGSSFVRVVNPDGTPLTVKVADGPAQTLSGEKIASTYAIVKGNATFTVSVDGKAAATLKVAPDSFDTLVPRREGSKLTFTVIDDGGGSQDALKAELRFYNFARGCEGGRLAVAPAGPMLFSNVAERTAAARPINPVSAKLTAACAVTISSAVTLPALQPGDHYSLFLTGTAAKPVLLGQVSATDPYAQ